MTGVKETVYRPNKAAAQTYAGLYAIYRVLHDAFGTPDFQGRVYGVMKDLIAVSGEQSRKG